MKKEVIKLLNLLPLLVLLGSCKKENVEPVQPSERIELLSYAKTPCFGFCEAYEFTLMSDNSACFIDYYPKILNQRHSRNTICQPIESEVWKVIESKARQMNIEKLGGIYPNDSIEVVDASKTIIKIRLDGKLIEIQDSYGAPIELDAFEQIVESVITAFRKRLPLPVTDSSRNKI